ncbi:MAG TPA: hypothetical protein VGN54_00880 [Mycobacteriales bacterium]|jgi:hypothetical protein|nr:hypothetical protein [Mycobacteriales bacterium]
MDSRRPDYAAYVAALGLPAYATELNVLSRAGGRRKGDTLEVVAEPDVTAAGAVDHSFLVRGIGHLEGNQPALHSLTNGASMFITAQPDNAVNPNALRVCTSGGSPVGWVPDALLHITHEVIENAYQLTAARANGPDWPNHMRLVVRLRGHVPPGFEPFGEVMSHQQTVAAPG